MPPSPVPPLPVDPWAVALACLPLVEQVARGFHRGLADTDDLVQEGLIAAHRAAGKNDPARDTFDGLVRVAARNRMCSWLRWRYSDHRATGDVATAQARPDRLDAVDLDDALFAVWCLPDHRRQILREHFGLAGPKRLEAAIGVALGMTRDAVAKNKSRALDKVREQLGIAS